MKIAFPSENISEQGKITTEVVSNLEMTEKYSEVNDFKLERIELWALDAMKESSDNSVVPQQQNNPIKPFYDSLEAKFEKLNALMCYREN